MKRSLILLLVLLAQTHFALAECDWAVDAEKSGKIDVALMQYLYCAEDENDVDAQYSLGTLFYKGLGISAPDYKKAALFYSKAAKQGYAPAQVKLGLLFWRGEGVQKDLREAYKWLYLAQEDSELRWFYPVGVSQSPDAEQIFHKIDKFFENKDQDLMENISSFQYENLRKKAGDYLTADEMNQLENYFKRLSGAILTHKNFNYDQEKILKKLRKIVDKGSKI
ncbi:MAG: sel1 repeat family protein [Alphaproteobacteria bacterium]|nr:sel1 repeat family protein [Alphaproteobacteria bacterium]